MVLGELAIQLRHVLRRRSGDVLESRHAEVVGTEDFHYGFLVLPVADHQIVLLLLVRADLIQLDRRISRRQLCFHSTGVRTGGTDPRAEHGMSRSFPFQRHVQRHPRLQAGLSGKETGLLALQAGQILQRTADAAADFLSTLSGFLAEELLLGDRSPGSEQPVLRLCETLDGVQRGVHLRDLALCLRQTGCSAFQQSGPGRVSQLVVWLADLHTAQMQKALQKFIPVVGHRHDAEFFHFYNGHFSDSQPFRQ